MWRPPCSDCNRHAPAPHADLSAVYYAMLRRTPWRQHSKLVVVTPDGLPLTQPESQLLPTLSKLSVQSLADFSRRLLPGHQIGQEVRSQTCLANREQERAMRRRLAALLCPQPHVHTPPLPLPTVPYPQLDALQPPASFEGGEQRCFQDLFVCGRNFPLARGLAPAEEAALTPQQQAERLAQEVPIEPFSFGQAVVAYQTQAARTAGQASAGNVQDGISLQEAAAAASRAGTAGSAGERAKTSGRLKVLLIKRGGEGRQLLNAAELLQACNSWSWVPPGSSKAVTADCREVGWCIVGMQGSAGGGKTLHDACPRVSHQSRVLHHHVVNLNLWNVFPSHITTLRSCSLTWHPASRRPVRRMCSSACMVSPPSPWNGRKALLLLCCVIGWRTQSASHQLLFLASLLKLLLMPIGSSLLQVPIWPMAGSCGRVAA